MRLLYITDGFPYPLTNGRLRHYHFIRELSQRHAITLVSIVRGGLTAEQAAAMAPFTEQVLAFASPGKGSPLMRRIIHRARLLVNREAPVRQMCYAVRELMRRERFDAVLLSGKQTSPVLRELRGLPVIVDVCDADSVRLRGALRYIPRAWLPIYLLDYLRVRNVENRLVRSAAHLLFASCRDREFLLGAANPRATVIPNGIDLQYWSRRSPTRGEKTIVFTGGMGYAPNTDAALYLIEEILPRIEQSVPDVQVLMVGRDPPPRLLAAGRRRGVEITGLVDDVRPYLERATVSVAPLRFGAGIQNKVLEAMAMEVPVVASSLAADGLRTEDGRRPPVDIADGTCELAESLVRRLEDWTSDPGADLAARRFVAEHFDWKRGGQRLQEILQAVAGARC